MAAIAFASKNQDGHAIPYLTTQQLLSTIQFVSLYVETEKMCKEKYVMMVILMALGARLIVQEQQ